MGIKTKLQGFPPVSKPLERVSVDITDMVVGRLSCTYDTIFLKVCLVCLCICVCVNIVVV